MGKNKPHKRFLTPTQRLLLAFWAMNEPLLEKSYRTRYQNRENSRTLLSLLILLIHMGEVARLGVTPS